MVDYILNSFSKLRFLIPRDLIRAANKLIKSQCFLTGNPIGFNLIAKKVGLVLEVLR